MPAPVRPATATPTDADAFAVLANMASHGILADLPGPGYPGILAAMLLDDATLYRASQVWFTTEGDAVTGMLCAFTGEQKAALNGATDRYFLSFPGADGEPYARVREHLAPLSVQIDTVPGNAVYIQFLAVAPPWRGNGHARALLDHAVTLAHQQGAATIELDVEIDNTAALAAYRRAGFGIARTSPTIWYDAQSRPLGMHRMVRAVEPGPGTSG